MKILCTMPGKFGDLLWSLPTVRAIAEQAVKEIEGKPLQGCFVDLGIMPEYRSLLPLLNVQPYISKAFVIENWICTGSHAGDQPWEAPVNILVNETYIHTGVDILTGNTYHYDKVYHLGYRNHPPSNKPLVDFIAEQQGIKLEKPIPFIDLTDQLIGKAGCSVYSSMLAELESITKNPTITWSFNDSMRDYKDKFLDDLKQTLPEVNFLYVGNRHWVEAAYLIKHSLAFIGCRSSNYVLACGVGKKVYVYEPNISRSIKGMWGTTFSCPYANEIEVANSSQVIEEEYKNAFGKTIAG